MREAAEQFVGKAGQTGRLAHSRRELCAAPPAQPAQRIGDRLKRREARVQALAGILEDHLDAGTLRHAGEVPRGYSPDLVAIEPDAAAARINEARDEPHQGRLAAAGLPDEAHCLARSDRKIRRYRLRGASFGVRGARDAAPPRFTGKCLVRLRISRTGSVIRAASKRPCVTGRPRSAAVAPRISPGAARSARCSGRAAGRHA